MLLHCLHPAAPLLSSSFCLYFLHFLFSFLPVSVCFSPYLFPGFLSTPSLYFLLLLLLDLSPLLFPLLFLCSSSQSPIPASLPPCLSLPHFTALPSTHANTHLDLNSLPHSPTGQLCFSVLIGPVFLLLHGSINKLFHGWEVRGAAGLGHQETLQYTNMQAGKQTQIQIHFSHEQSAKHSV